MLRAWSENGFLKAAFVVVTVGTSCLFLGYVVYRSWDQLAAYEWQLSIWPLIAAIVLHVLMLALVVAVWAAIVGRLTKGSRWRDAEIYFLSNLSRRLPGTAWYIAGRLYMYSGEGIARADVLSATAVETGLLIVSGVLTYVACLALVEPLGWSKIGLAFGTLALAGSPVLLQVTIGRPLLALRPLRALGRSLAQVNPVDTLRWLALYTVAWVLAGLVLFSLAKGVYSPLRNEDVVRVVGAWAAAGTVSSLVFMLPSGLGLREVGISLLLSQTIPLSAAIIIAVLFRLLIMLNETVWTLLFLLIIRLGRRLAWWDAGVNRPA